MCFQQRNKVLLLKVVWRNVVDLRNVLSVALCVM